MASIHSHILSGPLRWFECNGLQIAIESASSALLEEIDLAQADVSVVEDLVDMVLLDEIDILLSCLDEWFETNLDWQPLRIASSEKPGSSQDNESAVALHDMRGAPRLTASLHTLEGSHRRLFMALDLKTLESMPPLPMNWQSLVEFYCYVKPMVLRLEQLCIAEHERQKLACGALVLLEASFKNNWQTTLVSEFDQGWEITSPDVVFVDAEEGWIRLLPPTTSGKQDSGTQDRGYSIQIELQDPIQLNELYTQSVWQAQQNMVTVLPQALNELLLTVRLCWSDDIQDSDEPLVVATQQVWNGSLMRVGSGYGVMLGQQSA